MTAQGKLLPTTVVGSYPQPAWLVDGGKLKAASAARARARVWRVQDHLLEQAQDDATILAIRDMERAGIDILPTAKSGASAIPTTSPPRSRVSTSKSPARSSVVAVPDDARSPRGRPDPPHVAGRVRDIEFLRANTDHTSRSPCRARSPWPSRRRTSSTATTRRWRWPTPSPSTRKRWISNAPAPMSIQLDEPWLQAFPENAKRYGVRAINRALQGVTARPSCISVSATRRWSRKKPSGYSFLPRAG